MGKELGSFVLVIAVTAYSSFLASLSKTYWHQLTFSLHWASSFIFMTVETSVTPTVLRECLKDSKVVYFKGSDLGRPNEISSKDKFTNSLVQYQTLYVQSGRILLSVNSWGQEPSKGLPGTWAEMYRQACAVTDSPGRRDLPQGAVAKAKATLYLSPGHSLFVWVLSWFSPTDSGLRQLHEPSWGCFWPDWWQSVTNT